MKILIGASSSYKAIVIAKYLKKHYPNYNIYGLADKQIFTKIHSKYFDNIIVIQNKIKNNFEKSISVILESNDFDLYIPVDSLEYSFIYKNEKILKLKQLFYLGSKDSYNKLNNKQNLHLLCEELGLNIPKTYYNSIQNIKIGYVVKPTDLTSSKGVLYIKTIEDINKVKQAVLKYKDFIVQEYIEGVGVGYSVFANNGKIKVGLQWLMLIQFSVGWYLAY